MKTIKNACLAAFLSVSIPMFSQKPLDSQDIILKIHPLPAISMYFDHSLGFNFLTNTKLSQNKPLSSNKTVSGCFYEYIDIPFLMKTQPHRSEPFSLRPGIGLNVKNFGLNKQLTRIGDKSKFTNPAPGLNYSYTIFQQIFIELPLGIAFTTNSNEKGQSFEFVIGGVFGFLIYKEYTSSVNKGNSTLTIHDSDIPNLNPMEYGASFSVRANHLFKNRKMGYSYFTNCNYYLSNMFEPSNGTSTKSFSILLGLSIFMNHSCRTK
jgi:hypothetical protein